MTTLIITIILILLAGSCWAIMNATIFGSITDKPDSFFGKESWVRKYYVESQIKNGMVSSDWFFKKKYKLDVFAVMPKWYYSFFEIKYIERFPFSCTILVFVTDAYHLFQFLATKFIFAAIAINTEAPIIYFFLCLLLWSIGFNVALKIARK